MESSALGGRSTAFRDRAQSSTAEAPDRPPLSTFLRPAKIRNAVGRRLINARLRQAIEIDTSLSIDYLGTPYGGWPIPAGLVRPDWTVYSVGAGTDVSFDTELIHRTGCHVHSFDPTDASAQHIAALNEPRLHFHQVAVWKHDGILKMYRAAVAHHAALSAANLQKTRSTVDAPCRSLQSITRELGHSRVDLLKYHLEGGEYQVFDPEILSRWSVRVLILPLFHTAPAHQAIKLVHDVVAQGYRPVARKDTAFTFVREGTCLRSPWHAGAAGQQRAKPA